MLLALETLVEQTVSSFSKSVTLDFSWTWTSHLFVTTLLLVPVPMDLLVPTTLLDLKLVALLNQLIIFKFHLHVKYEIEK